MRERGLISRVKRKLRRTTNAAHKHPVEPNLVAREFTAAAPNRVWVGDITYVWTAEGWLYVAVLIDLFSRRVVGWAAQKTLARDLALAALHNAVTNRRPPPGLIHHADRGSQGEFNWSLQHLNKKELQWVLRMEDGQVARDAHLCVHQVARWQGDVNIGNGFGRRSRSVCRARTRRSSQAYRSRWERGGSARMAACRRATWLNSPGATCRSPNVRRLRYYMHRTSGS